MDKELTSAQCDEFVKQHRVELRYGFFKQWICSGWGEARSARTGGTRQAAITAYWQRYYPDWEPPEFHDLEWAVGYIEENNLFVQRGTALPRPIPWVVRGGQSGYRVLTKSTLLNAVKAWHEKYGNEQSEPTVLEITERLYRELETMSLIRRPPEWTILLEEARAVINRERKNHDG